MSFFLQWLVWKLEADSNSWVETNLLEFLLPSCKRTILCLLPFFRIARYGESVRVLREEDSQTKEQMAEFFFKTTLTCMTCVVPCRLAAFHRTWWEVTACWAHSFWSPAGDLQEEASRWGKALPGWVSGTSATHRSARRLFCCFLLLDSPHWRDERQNLRSLEEHTGTWMNKSNNTRINELTKRARWITMLVLMCSFVPLRAFPDSSWGTRWKRPRNNTTAPGTATWTSCHVSQRSSRNRVTAVDWGWKSDSAPLALILVFTYKG